MGSERTQTQKSIYYIIRFIHISNTSKTHEDHPVKVMTGKENEGGNVLHLNQCGSHRDFYFGKLHQAVFLSLTSTSKNPWSSLLMFILSLQQN
jgi:hypothetical protein